MSDFVELVTGFPTVVFTFLLALCLAWWLIATVAGVGDGFDSEPDVDGALDDIGDALGISSVPPAIGLSILSFVGWVVSLPLTALAKSWEMAGLAAAATGVGVMVLSFAVGTFATRRLAKRVSPLFTTELAPSQSEAVGAFARVRSSEIDDDDSGPPGEVVVTSGRLRGATFRARARPGRRFTAGETVHIIEAHQAGPSGLVVTVDEATPEIAP